MRVEAVSLQNFRNIQLARLDLSGQRCFISGPNGQGKTNLLEAISLVTALRSFRTNDSRTLIHWGEPFARLIWELDHEQLGESRLELMLERGKKKVLLDGEPAARLADIIGKFPTVAMSSQDIQLLRGGPGERRRFIDLSLSGADPFYFEALRRYTRALKERNQLLKRGRRGGEIRAFEVLLAQSAVQLISRRRRAIEEMSLHLREAYNAIATQQEDPFLEYRPDLDTETEDDFLNLLEGARARDEILQSTSRGPHRDDLLLQLKSHEARDFASEGQQRGLVLALRLAELRWLHQKTGVLPVLLADDILGELDPDRRTRFWAALPSQAQIFATGTQTPTEAQTQDWRVLSVFNGAFASAAT